jgi:serralysin
MGLTTTDLETKIETGNVWIDALVSKDGNQWNLNYLEPFRDSLTYSFSIPSNLLGISVVESTLAQLNASQRSSVITALEYISELTGIVFEKTESNSADLHLFNGDIVDAGVAGHSKWNYQYTYSSSTKEIQGFNFNQANIVFDNVDYLHNNQNPTVGSYGYQLILHELGHYLGLKHPFEGPIELAGIDDKDNNSLMSYNKSTPYKSEFSPYDLAALAFLYGGDGLGGEYGYSGKTNIILGTARSEIIVGSNSDDLIDGGDGVDTVIFSGARALASLEVDGQSIGISSSTTGIDTLVNVERVQFSDLSLAFDINGDAGFVAKLLGAVLGAEGVSNEVYVGMGIHFLESGLSFEELMGSAIDTVLGAEPSSRAVVNLLYTNVVGVAPSESELLNYAGILDSGTMSIAQLGVEAANTGLNESNIDLVGLATIGLDYIPVV